MYTSYNVIIGCVVHLFGLDQLRSKYGVYYKNLSKRKHIIIRKRLDLTLGKTFRGHQKLKKWERNDI